MLTFASLAPYLSLPLHKNAIGVFRLVIENGGTMDFGHCRNLMLRSVKKMSPANFSRAVDNTCLEGYCKREDDENDGRKCFIVLTPMAKTWLKKVGSDAANGRTAEAK